MHNPFRDLPKKSGDFRSNPIMRRYAGNPILTKKDVPYPAAPVLYGAGDISTNLAETTLDELWSIMPPCSRLAERAAIPFQIEDWRQ